MKLKKGVSSLIVIIILAILFIVALFFVFKVFNTKDKGDFSLDLQIRNTQSIISPEEKVFFKVTLITEKDSSFDLKYQIFKSETSELMWEEKKAHEVSLQSELEENYDHNFEEGEYILRVTAESENRVKVANILFTVEQKKLPSVLKERSERNENSEDIKQELEEPKEEEKTFIEIFRLGEENQNDAVKECNKLEENNECLYRLAHELDNPLICSQIKDIPITDGCYGEFALKGKYDFCDKIRDAYQRVACLIISNTENEE